MSPSSAWDRLPASFLPFMPLYILWGLPKMDNSLVPKCACVFPPYAIFCHVSSAGSLCFPFCIYSNPTSCGAQTGGFIRTSQRTCLTSSPLQAPVFTNYTSLMIFIPYSLLRYLCLGLKLLTLEDRACVSAVLISCSSSGDNKLTALRRITV